MEDNRRRGGDGGAVAAAKKKRRNKRRRDPRKGPPPARGPPETPVLKVTIRNIYHSDVAGSIRLLIANANEKLTGLDPKMILDEEQLQKLIAEQKAAVDAEEKWKAEKDNALNNEETKADEEHATSIESTESTGPNVVDSLADAVDKNLHLSKTNGSSSAAHVGIVCTLKSHQICTRVLYMVAPKKTRRRGEKPGVAYLILTAPPMESLAPVVEPPRSNNALVEQSVATKSDETVTSQSSSVSNHVPPTTVDYTRDVAKRRLMLQNAMNAMQAVVQVDAANNVDAMVVVESINSKVWKSTVGGSRPSPMDRMVGTIFDTDDYKQFLERTVKEEEQRLARPKPAPGGGMAYGSSSGATDNSTQPVAALVLHLQQKQEEEKKRKLAKRKTKETKSKKGVATTEKTNGAVNEGSNGGKGGKGGTGQKIADKKRLRRPRKRPPASSNGTKPEAAKPS